MKWVISLANAVFAFYPAFELSRMIGQATGYYPHLITNFRLELGAIWMGYLAIIILPILILDKREARHGLHRTL